jgi:uncharacterized membrane protein YdjX (TVP38/TMEM64 family)
VKRAATFLFLLAAFTTTVVAVRRYGGSALDPQALVALLDEARASGWVVPVYVLIFGLTTFLVPAFVFFVVAGAVWGFWPGWLIGWLVANCWSCGAFGVGRWLGGERVRHFLERRHLHGVLEELQHGGVLAATIVRQFPLPFVGVNVAAGASPIRFNRWALGNALGLLPGATVYAYSAASVLTGVGGAKTDAVIRTLVAAAAIIALGVFSRWAQRRFLPRPPAAAHSD